MRSEPTLEVKNLLSRRFRQGGDNANASEGNRKQDKQTTCLDLTRRHSSLSARRSSKEAKKKMSTTSTKQFKVYAEVGDIMGFEVKVINHERRLVIGDLDTGEGCVLPFGQLGKDRLDSLREPLGSDGGSEFNVRVLDAYTDSRSRRRILVSERAVEDRVFHQHVDHNTAESEVVPTNLVPAEVLATARQKKTLGHTVRGTVVGDAPGGGKRVDIGKFIAILSREELAGVSPESLRKGVTVKVKFLDVTENSITLTRKGVA